MRSLIAQGVTNFDVPPECSGSPCRKEVTFSLRDQGRIYRFVARDKLMPEDPYLVLVKAALFSIRHAEPYAGRATERNVKDFLIKQNLVL